MKTINAQQALALVEKFRVLKAVLEPMYACVERAAIVGHRTVTCYCSREHKDQLADRLRTDGFEVKIGVFDDRMGWPLVISW